MTQLDGFDRTLAQWFEAESQPAATAEVLERALDVTRRHRPRPRVVARLGSHWVGGTARSTGTVVLIVAALVIGLVLGAIALSAGRVRPTPDIRHLGHLAYATGDGLYVADWDGGNARRILDQSHLADILPARCDAFWGGPRWSPDGRHLAIRTAWNDLCPGSILITDAGGADITTIPGSGWEIAWSPDSRRIVTWVETFKTIGVFGLDGERQVVLPKPWRMTSGDHDPGWMPDGSAVLVPNGVVVPLDGSTPYLERALTPVRSSVSPDGASVAYPQWDDRRSVVVAARDGSSERVFDTVAADAVVHLTWSPTGDRLALDVTGRPPVILDLAADTTTDVDLAGVDVTIDEPVSVVGFSPEGDRLLVRALGRASSLWSVGIDGTGARKLVDAGEGGDWQWAWDGS